MHTLGQRSVDNSRPYVIGYEFIQNLHTLEDIRIAWPQLYDKISEKVWNQRDSAADVEGVAELSVQPLSQGGRNMLMGAQRNVLDLLDAWNVRSTVGCPSQIQNRDLLLRATPEDMGPILANRRRILRSLPNLPEDQLRVGLTKLLAMSARLARENDLTNTALSFLTDAKKNGLVTLELEEERALYVLEKRQVSDFV